MKKDTTENALYQHLSLFGASASQLKASRERIRERLRRREQAPLDTMAASAFPSPALRHGWQVGALAAAAAVLALLITSGRWREDTLATVDAPDGSLYSLTEDGWRPRSDGYSIVANETIRSNGGAGAMLALADGSRVEMRSESELALDRADDGVRIRLNQGGIIVNAAKQRSSHLYVQTRDVSVSVVGTVFLVNAEERGSRVAVIEGEVRVQQGATEMTLLSGEQVATSERMATTITNDVTWSRNATDHLAVFHQFAVPAPALAPQDAPREEFEVVSIRRSVVPSGEGGRGGRGGGGVSRRNRRGDDPCSLGGEPVVDPRRFDAVNVTVVQLVSWAYGLDCWMNRGPDVLFGGPPDWIKQDGFDVLAVVPEGSPGYTRQQLRSHDAPVLQRMLQSMLVNRFELVTRRETREMPVYVLSVAQGGPRYTKVNSPPQLTDVDGNPVDEPPIVNGVPMPAGREPPADRANPEFSIWQEGDSRDVLQLGPSEIHGRQKTIADLASTLSLFTGRPVLDRTGLTGRFNFFFEFAVVECPTCPFTAPGPGTLRVDGLRPESGTPWPDRSLGSVLEQVGLELRPSREQVDVLVIERVERPSEN